LELGVRWSWKRVSVCGIVDSVATHGRTLVFGALLAAAVAFAGVAVETQSKPPATDPHTDHAPPAAFNGPIALYMTAMGPFRRPISSRNSEAQAFFNQGFQLTYAFARPEAVRSFREAETRDPECAICYWGEAWAWGSDLNWTMSAEEAPLAYAAIQKAIALAPAHATPIEQALIRAMSVRYVARFDPARRGDQDRAYADAMKQVVDAYPNDLDAAVLYAEALFLLEPRAGRRDLANPNVQRIVGVLERALANDIHHPGACHLYVHITESTSEPERASACAEFLGRSIPGASHINHMPSHTWTHVGRWGDAVRASLDAWHSDLKSLVGEGVAIYPWHDLQMLVFAASMDGQGAIAVQAGRDYSRMTKNPIYLLLTLVRFGRFEDILVDLSTKTPGLLSGPVWDFAQGYAQLRAGNRAAAQTHLTSLVSAANTSTAQFGANSAKELFGVLARILEGEIALAGADRAAAITAFEKAVAIEDALVWDEPEPLPFSARHWLGPALIEAGRPADAETVYREDLKRHPKNGWSLLGLSQALAAQGKPSREVTEEFDRAWSRSDTWIRSSRF
jgi:tetratricopeptide (TPR) repeat protein